MDKEILFAQTLEAVKQTAREQANCVSEEEVKKAFQALALTDTQLQMVYDYLRQHKIGIDVPLDTEEYLTREEKDYLAEYLEELSLLTPAGEGEWETTALSAMKGDPDAQSRLLQLFLPRIVDIAKLYASQGVYLEDLVGEGNVTIVSGVAGLGSLKKAEEAEGMLARLVMDAMEEYISSNAEESRKDARLADKVNKVADAAKELAEALGKKVTAAELSKETGIKDGEIQDALRMSGYRIEYMENQTE